MIENEQWHDVPGYEGRYQASDRGRIRGVRSGKILKGQRQNQGYRSYHLTNGGRHTRRIFLGHRLVADAFFGASADHVNHKDGDKQNNDVSNLERTTRSENALHAFSTGLRLPPKKSVIGVPLAGGPVLEFAGQKDVEVHFRGRATGVISRCLKGLCGSAYGYVWGRV